ncbi:hypothetical protein ACLOJK_015267 [Asimina triloba]
MALKKVGHPTPYGEAEARHPPQPQCEERSSPHNAVTARSLHVADAPLPEDRPGDVGEISCLAGDDEIPLVTDAALVGVPSPLAATALTPDMAPNLHHLQATSQPHPSSTLRAPDGNNLLAFHLQMQPISNGFRIPEMAIFRPTLDPTGHVVNYNIHMDLRTTSKGLKCRAFLATLDKQGKMWFASLTPSSIASFRQLIDLFEARFSNQWQRPVIAAQLICIPLRDYMTRFNQVAQKVPCLLTKCPAADTVAGGATVAGRRRRNGTRPATGHITHRQSNPC